MKSTGEHSRLLAAAARDILAPLGVIRKGRSRTWLDDHGWWLIVTEFQPSSWSKGSYLNVGAMWLWYEKDHFSFDHGNRVQEFVNYRSEDQFASEAVRLATSAREKILEYRRKFTSASQVARTLSSASPKSGWDEFHIGVAYGCSGDMETARKWLRSVERSNATYDWEKKLQSRAHELADRLSDPASFRMAIEEAIRASRRHLKLGDCGIEGLFTASSTVYS